MDAGEAARHPEACTSPETGFRGNPEAAVRDGHLGSCTRTPDSSAGWVGVTTTPASVNTGRPLAHWLGLGVLLTVATAVLLVWWVGVDELLAALRELSPAWLVVAAVSEALALACLTRVYATIFRVVHDELPAREATTVALGAFSLSQVLPGGGAAGGVFAAHRLARRSDAVTGTATVVLFGALSMGPAVCNCRHAPRRPRSGPRPAAGRRWPSACQPPLALRHVLLRPRSSHARCR